MFYPREKPKPVYFLEMMLKTFCVKKFLQSFIPTLSGLLVPIVQDSVERAVKGMQESVVDLILEANDELIKTVERQSKTISDQ